jgi:rare lipoprotein A
VFFSWYGEFFHGRKMANGKIFDMYNENVIAHKTLAFGTIVEVFNPKNNIIILAVVEDRGPYIAGRDFDLSYAGAKKLDIIDEGVAKLQFRVIE